MVTDEERAAIIRAAQARAIAPAMLMAVIEIESGGRFSTRINGRSEPLIRFEGHYFDRLLAAGAREEARRLGLASPVAGRIANPPDQAGRWALLARAAAIDARAAYAATSWGIGQVMGDHWRRLGFESVEDLVAKARSGFAGQLDLMLRYIDEAGLVDALRRRDFPAFARGYNGPAYRRNAYDTKLAAAYRRHAALFSDDADAPANLPRLLSAGMRGADVAALQTRLDDVGYLLVADGIFGARTAAALRRFQAAHGLAADGIAGPLTMAALGRKNTETGLFNRFRAVLSRVFGVVMDRSGTRR